MERNLQSRPIGKPIICASLHSCGAATRSGNHGRTRTSPKKSFYALACTIVGAVAEAPCIEVQKLLSSANLAHSLPSSVEIRRLGDRVDVDLRLRPA
jgi:hypothetical protein